MELVVWPGAWDVPSLDPECLATIFYTLSVECENSKAIRIVVDSDPSRSPTGMRGSLAAISSHSSAYPSSNEPSGAFPLLRCNCAPSAIALGYISIVEHLRSCPHVNHHPESHLQQFQLADITAWTHNICAKAQQLLDLYLYVSSENYYASTRPTWARLLPWYSKMITPPTQRRRAKDRTSHLGLSGLDLDEVAEKVAEESRKGSQQAGPGIGSAMQRHGRVRSLLGQSEYVDSFRLNALIDQFCTPLIELLDTKNWLLIPQEEPSSVDFVASAYLLVMLRADLPKRWLAKAIEKKYPLLKEYALRVEGTLSQKLKSVQPETRQSATWTHGFAFLGNQMLKSIQLFDRPTIRRTPETVAAIERHERSKHIFERYPLFQIATTSVAALGLTALTALGYLQWHTKREGDFVIKSAPRKLADFGEAGEFLAMYGAQTAGGSYG
jgi:hypothetical protein